jgi:Ni,Fe-hydrogenase maturation factor
MRTYTEEQLIAFGNYLLSDERKKMVKRNNRKMVHHADVENFHELSEIKRVIEEMKEFLETLHSGDPLEEINVSEFKIYLNYLYAMYKTVPDEYKIEFDRLTNEVKTAVEIAIEAQKQEAEEKE